MVLILTSSIINGTEVIAGKSNLLVRKGSAKQDKANISNLLSCYSLKKKKKINGFQLKLNYKYFRLNLTNSYNILYSNNWRESQGKQVKFTS